MASSNRPLAEDLRPQSLDDFRGQAHLVGEGKPLRLAIENGQVPSMILWGPPGVGKTTLARIIASHTEKAFVALSAVSAGKADLRAVVERAGANAQPTLFDPTPAPEGIVLFLDEIHRFNKAQQDFLLPYVEDGTVTLIGATTENPSFTVISALLSRSQVFVLESLTDDDLREIIRRGTTTLGITVEAAATDFLANYANGDGRQALNLLEATAGLYTNAENATLTAVNLRDALQSKFLRYDKSDEEHYNTISAYIKSMRASNIDAALYYLARMVHAGEDPRFIARRLVIFASEDVGLADPNALVLANAIFRAVETIGYPEAQINLAHGTAYMAHAPKDKSAYMGYFRALDDVREHGNQPIPMALRNAPTPFMKEQGYGDGYEAYTDADLLPDKLKGTRYYVPDSDETGS